MYRSNPFYYADGIKRMISFGLIMGKAKNGETIEVWGDSSRKMRVFMYRIWLSL